MKKNLININRNISLNKINIWNYNFYILIIFNLFFKVTNKFENYWQLNYISRISYIVCKIFFSA